MANFIIIDYGDVQDDCFQTALDDFQLESASDKNRSRSKKRSPLRLGILNTPTRDRSIQRTTDAVGSNIHTDHIRTTPVPGKDGDDMKETDADSACCLASHCVPMTTDSEEVGEEAIPRRHTRARRASAVKQARASPGKSRTPVPTRTLRSGRIIPLMAQKSRTCRVKRSEEAEKPDTKKDTVAEAEHRRKGKQVETEGASMQEPTLMAKLARTKKRQRRIR